MGNVTQVDLNTCQVYDVIGGETHTIHIVGEAILEIKPGIDAIFIGEYVQGKLRAKKIEISKFLNALYEEDLFDSSGSWTLVQVVDDPFPEIFKKFLAERQAMEAEMAELELEQNTKDLNFEEPEDKEEDESEQYEL